MEEAGDLLEASWFFENLLNTKSRTISRCFSDLSSSSYSTQEHVEKERKSSSFSSRKAEPVASETQVFLTKKANSSPGLTRASSMSISVAGSDQKDHVNVEKERKSSGFSSRKAEPVASETQSFLTKNPNPSPGLMRALSMSTSEVGSDQRDRVNVEKERKSLSFSSRKAEPVGSETQSFLMKKPNPSPRLTRASSMSTSEVGSDQRDRVNVEKERKSLSFSSRKQRPVAPLPTPIEARSSITKKPIPSRLTRASSNSMMASVVVSDHEDEEEDQESEFSLGRLIRQASMKSSHTLNPSRQTAKAMPENLQKEPELYQQKIGIMGSMERNRSKTIKNSGKNNGGVGGGSRHGGGAPAIPGGLVDKSSSEDMKAHIKFWARAVASNVRQECS
ncbi:hypothetical protein OSB04_030357 [Centaurea solstitialis]|uniref:Uncharacterized protein n=1 Tax=Centaurea solstitialis TaxID=347529 RepID=A0AA38S8M5_9ASTR|nr:hypothetical protein OSB04_030357 [Centaurea solstitialis]